MMGFLGKNVILTIHSEHTIKEQLNNISLIKRAILVFALKNMRLIIAVSPRIKSFLVSIGLRADRIECIPAYISPVVRTEEIAEIPESVFTFVNRHHPVLVANASRIVFFKNQDLYGIDMCIDLCSRLKEDFPQIGFVFCLPETGDYEYFCKMKKRVRENQLEEIFLFQTKACQMYPIIMKSDLFVRPTFMDGYSVSVSEAIHFKIPVVASDVCPRPAGTILFQNRDIDNFTFTVKKVLSDHASYKNEITEINQIDNAERIIGIYRRLMDCKY
jgi:glycosyltransferase involved in cell wall biosynthesis